MLIAGYMRVSKEEQHDGLQRDAINDWAAKRGHQVEFFYDRGISGVVDNRRQLERMLKELGTGKYSHVVVWRLDRLARSLIQLIRIVDTLRKLVVPLVSIHENIDMDTPTGKFTFHIFAAVAEFERDLIKERIIAGVAAAKARGVIFGRPRSVAPEVVLDFIMSGGDIKSCAEKFNVCSETVRNIIRRKHWKDALGADIADA